MGGRIPAHLPERICRTAQRHHAGQGRVPALWDVSFVFNATWFHILAGCYMTWTQTNDAWDRLARFIRAAALEAAGSSGLLQDAGMIKPDGSGIFVPKRMWTEPWPTSCRPPGKHEIQHNV